MGMKFTDKMPEYLSKLRPPNLTNIYIGMLAVQSIDCRCEHYWSCLVSIIKFFYEPILLHKNSSDYAPCGTMYSFRGNR